MTKKNPQDLLKEIEALKEQSKTCTDNKTALELHKQIVALMLEYFKELQSSGKKS